MATLDLLPATMRRINRIAKESERTVEEVMPGILKYGLDATEEHLEFLRSSEADEKAGRLVDEEDFERDCRSILNAKRKEAA